MALHYSANQFNQEFKGQRLCNWEVPHRYPERPRARTGHTRIIANDRGHLLPTVPRPTDSPWGHFVPTWRMPRRITRQIAAELQDPKLAKKKLKSKAIPLPPPTEPDNLEDPNKEPKKVEEIKEQFDDTPCKGLPEKPPEDTPVCPIHGFK